MIQVVVDDLQKSKADLLIIPHSTAGTISSGFEPLLLTANLSHEKIPSGDLGDVKILLVGPSSDFKYVAFACSVHEQSSSYTTIFRLLKELRQQLPTDVTSISLPLLGTGSGHLDFVNTYSLISKTFDELYLPDLIISVFITDKNLYRTLQEKAALFDGSIEKLVFILQVEAMKVISWVKDMLDSPDFYFEKAQQKFQEYLAYNPTGFNFTDILNDFSVNKHVFSKYLYRYEEESPEYKFLLLCGQLVSYIDRNAYNKRQWNEYDDNRTMAQSSVNQTRWIQNLIAFKANPSDVAKLPPSIKNAISYLLKPSVNLTMLSENHRKVVSTKLFTGKQGRYLVADIQRFFDDLQFKCLNPDNYGVLYSQILYAPEIRYLWDESNLEEVESNIEVDTLDAVEMETNEVEDANTIRTKNLRTLMHSDIYAQIDLLNYEIYASIIARLITSDLSKPPFNISIYAPWGKGKTSLMRFIEKKIQPEKREEASVKERPENSVLTLINWLNKADDLFSDLKKIDFPIIWFNAWKFQKSEQIWAGLADEIIRQLSAQLESSDQEKFWLKLNLKRVDRDKLKRQLLFNFIQNMLIPIVWAFGGCIIYLLFRTITFQKIVDTILGPYSWLASTLPIAGCAYAAFLSTKGKWSKPPEFDVGKFVLQPQYRQKMGYLQMVEDDLRQAIGIVINEKKPAIIFIDDLDRCSPPVIAEVVEALNAFMSGDLSNCYFIIGHDPQMVTASLDASYAKIAEKLGKLDSQNSSIGRFFLEKFSQLSLNIPVLEQTQKEVFVESLLSTLDLDILPDKTRQKQLIEEYEILEKTLDTLADPEQIFTTQKTELEKEIILFQPGRVALFQDRILSSAFKNYPMDDNELENLINDVSDHLDSPRTIKRFINLYLFYHFFRLTVPGRRMADIDDETLGLWLLITVRWPLLVQAVQWDTEKGFCNGNDAFERAQRFDDLIGRSENFTTYLKLVEKELGLGLTWQCDEGLYQICHGQNNKQLLLSSIVKAGVW